MWHDDTNVCNSRLFSKYTYNNPIVSNDLKMKLGVVLQGINLMCENSMYNENEFLNKFCETFEQEINIIYTQHKNTPLEHSQCLDLELIG